MRLIKNCSICSKPLVLVSSVEFSKLESLNTYKCGHAFIELKDAVKQLNFYSIDKTKVARHYQEEGVKFIAESNFNCLIGDQMRLGKTPQALLALKNYYKEMTPCLILVRSANLWQWVREYQIWTDSLPLGVYTIVGSKSFIPPGFSAYIMSMDTFSREDMVTRLLAFGFKLVIVDEAHSFKNGESKRSQALVQFLHKVSEQTIVKNVKFNCLQCDATWEEEVRIVVTKDTKTVSKSSYCPMCNAYCRFSAAKEQINIVKQCGIVMLTGTAIKNRADEYFVPLNLLAPEKFPSHENFRRNWLMKNERGQWSSLNPYRIDQFKELIKPYVLRREKEDVYDDVPKINRMFTVITIEDKRLKDAYNKILDKLERELEENPRFNFFSSIGELTILRQICGMAKVDWTCDFIETCLDEDPNTKYAIGVHHHGVRDAIGLKLASYGVVKLSGEDSSESKDRIMTSFETDANHILAINTLAGGVGMDFHYIDEVKIIERQWSAADEEQFEFRFYNPDKSIKNRPTNIEYIVAKGTIDEFFYDMVEDKRKVFGETIGTNWSLSQDTDSFKKLIERTIAGRL